jgi:hypothetical protein
MVTILVSYWVNHDKKVVLPGDITIAVQRFPATDIEVEVIRDIIKEDLRKYGSFLGVSISNIIKLG